ncbi:TonB family protein [Pseudoxanthomonas sp. z9]|uniref:TonB family protein n=1 Tax=Pseudoxanthomonas sp. z9 TaxID=2584942 RepID=UPI0021053FC5|nr:TonB family protein [Pseudoxanthomonas sp. z9]
MSGDLLRLLLATTLATSLVILLLYLLRAPLRRWLGAGAAYASWLCVPVAALAVLLPAREVAEEWDAVGTVLMPMRAATAAAAPSLSSMWETCLLVAWLGGVVAMAGALWVRQHRFVRGLGELRRCGDGLWSATSTRGLPAAIGLFRPRIVVPADFESRYLERERVLIACHERLHISRGDLVANALVSVVRCVYWFNPLIHLAARRFRIDQELACDEDVIRRYPGARRSYGEAMLKGQLDIGPVPLACHWPAPHPLRERIAQLGNQLPSRRRRALATLLVAAMAVAVGYGAWATQPAPPAAATQEGLYHIAMQVSLGGATRAFEIREKPGKAFAVSGQTEAGETWKGRFRIETMAAGHARVIADIDVAGKSAGNPEMVIELGKSASLRLADENGKPSLSIELVVTLEQGAASPLVTGSGSISRTNRSVDHSTLAPPRYPASRHEGTVVMKLVIGTDGRVRQVGLERSSGFDDLDQAAMAAARGWRFEPAIEAGRAVVSMVRVPVEFSLDEPADLAQQAIRDPVEPSRNGPWMVQR